MKAKIQTVENCRTTYFLQQINCKKNRSIGGELVWTECLCASKTQFETQSPNVMAFRGCTSRR